MNPAHVRSPIRTWGQSSNRAPRARSVDENREDAYQSVHAASTRDCQTPQKGMNFGALFDDDDDDDDDES